MITLIFVCVTDGDGDDESNASKRRRSRTNFNSWQLEELERAFAGMKKGLKKKKLNEPSVNQIATKFSMNNELISNQQKNNFHCSQPLSRCVHA